MADALVIALLVVAFAVLAGGRRRPGEAPARASPVLRPRWGPPRLDPWPHPTVPGLAQPEDAGPELRMVNEALRERWQKGGADPTSPQGVCIVLHEMAESGARLCSRFGASDVGERFGMLRDRLASRCAGETPISEAESRAAMEEMTLLMSTVAAMAARRYAI